MWSYGSANLEIPLQSCIVYHHYWKWVKHVNSPSIYGFWLPLCYLQTILYAYRCIGKLIKLPVCIHINTRPFSISTRALQRDPHILFRDAVERWHGKDNVLIFLSYTTDKLLLRGEKRGLYIEIKLRIQEIKLQNTIVKQEHHYLALLILMLTCRMRQFWNIETNLNVFRFYRFFNLPWIVTWTLPWILLSKIILRSPW